MYAPEHGRHRARKREREQHEGGRTGGGGACRGVVPSSSPCVTYPRAKSERVRHCKATARPCVRLVTLPDWRTYPIVCACLPCGVTQLDGKRIRWGQGEPSPRRRSSRAGRTRTESDGGRVHDRRCVYLLSSLTAFLRLARALQFRNVHNALYIAFVCTVPRACDARKGGATRGRRSPAWAKVD